jgi:hypothetical protein
MANYLSTSANDLRAGQPKRVAANASAGPAEASKQQTSAEQAKSTQGQARVPRRPATTAEAGPAPSSQTAAVEETRPAVLLAEPPPAREEYDQFFWVALAGVFLLLAIGAIGGAIHGYRRLRTNRGFLHATLGRVTEMLDETVMQAEKYNVPRSATIALLGKAEGLLDDMGRYDRLTPQLRYRRAWMLIQFARNYGMLGHMGKQFARANEAYRLLTGVAAEKSNQIAWQRDLSVALPSAEHVRLVPTMGET